MAEQLAVRFDIPAHYTDISRMLAEQSVDVVHIATPPDSHVALSTLVFKAGCHVFLEKPVALTGHETRQILDAATQANRKLCINYLYNFEAPSLELKEKLATDKLGPIVHIEATYGYDLAGDYGVAVLSDAGHWVHRLPGKLFHNVLDHVICKLAMVMPLAPAQVTCLAFRARPAVGNPVIDALADELRFTLRVGNVTATAIVSAHARPVGHTMRVYGRKDSVILDYVGRTLVPAPRQTQPSSIGRLGPAIAQARAYAASARRNLGRFRRYEFHFFQGMRVLLDEFYQHIETGSPAPLSHEEILWSVDTIDAIVEQINLQANQARGAQA